MTDFVIANQVLLWLCACVCTGSAVAGFLMRKENRP